jgi:hypothetical protein
MIKLHCFLDVLGVKLYVYNYVVVQCKMPRVFVCCTSFDCFNFNFRVFWAGAIDFLYSMHAAARHWRPHNAGPLRADCRLLQFPNLDHHCPVAKLLHGSHVMRYKNYGLALLLNFFKHIKALTLEGGVANCQHFID